MGSRASRIVQLGTCAGYSALLLGWMLRRMNALHGLFSLDLDPAMCEIPRRWIARAGLEDFVGDRPGKFARSAIRRSRPGNTWVAIPSWSFSTALTNTRQRWTSWISGFAALAPGGLLALHDVSTFAADFDVTHQGGVKRAFAEWRKAHPDVETFCLNGDARTMDLPRPFYKDACGVGLIHKALT